MASVTRVLSAQHTPSVRGLAERHAGGGEGGACNRVKAWLRCSYDYMGKTPHFTLQFLFRMVLQSCIQHPDKAHHLLTPADAVFTCMRLGSDYQHAQ